MIGMVRDRDLKSGKPMIIVYRIVEDNTLGFSVIIDGDKCIVTPYTYNIHEGVRFGEKFIVRYSEIVRLDVRNKKEELFKFLFDRMLTRHPPIHNR